MKKFINNLISIIFIVILSSCTFNVGDKEDGDGDEENFLNTPSPVNNATDVPLTPQLNWRYNSNTNNISFDIYLDTYSSPSTLLAQVNGNSYYITTPLEGNKTYYWKVRTTFEGNTYESNVWSFTTINSGIPAEGLVAYYPFNGNEMDESGNGNNGQNFGAFLTWDRFNFSERAYGFSDISAYISVPHSPSLQPTSGLTLAAWVSFKDLGITSCLLSKGSESATGWYSLKYDTTGRTLDFQINFSDYISGPHMTVSSSSTLVVNTWYYVVGTYDGSYMRMYINGQAENSIYVPKSLGSNFEYLTIGNCPEGYPLNGSIDDIRIYKRALMDSEVLQLFHEGGWLKKSVSTAKR